MTHAGMTKVLARLNDLLVARDVAREAGDTTKVAQLTKGIAGAHKTLLDALNDGKAIKSNHHPDWDLHPVGRDYFLQNHF